MSNPPSHCCARMTAQVNLKCADHPDKFDCPDALIHFDAQTKSYRLIVHDGGSAGIAIDFCPWCGSTL
ncbi:MAG: DUF6980 family protein [Verrucomicrobiales bacterium]